MTEHTNSQELQHKHNIALAALNKLQDQRDQLAARLKDAAVPEGWQLVPVVPTKAMRKAFHDAHDEWESGGLTSPDHQWGAMLAAAPKPEGQ